MHTCTRTFRSFNVVESVEKSGSQRPHAEVCASFSYKPNVAVPQKENVPISIPTLEMIKRVLRPSLSIINAPNIAETKFHI